VAGGAGTLGRRRFVLAAGALLLASEGLYAQAQQAPRRIGILSPGSPAANTQYIRAFTEGLRERGHAEGRDIEIHVRFAEGREQRLAALAAEIAALRPAVIVAGGTVAVEAARKAAPRVPIVTLVGDVSSAGLAATLARPDSGVTGVSFHSATLDAKRLELLAALLPKGKAILNLTDSSARAGSHTALGETGRALGIVLHAVEARTPDEIDIAFSAARKLEVAGINVLTSPFLNTHRARIIKLAGSARLPVIYQWPETAEEGGLMGYGPRVTGIYGQLAGYASRILRGTSPAELPFEQPTKFELVVNLKTARSLLLRADRVIE
jgi:putative ABC transport system substrate-binding protein